MSAVGELRLDQNDPAGAQAAFERIPVDERPAKVILGLARTMSALEDRGTAAGLYVEYLDGEPEDVAVRLELARVLMMAGARRPGPWRSMNDMPPRKERRGSAWS